NGGFLQQTPIQQNEKILSPLPTRDAVIVPLTILLLAQQRQRTISELLNDLPQRYTYSDRLKDFPTEVSQRVLSTMMTANMESNLTTFKNQFPDLANPILINTIDGIRITLDNSEIVHLRPSGNAPELRCYTEANNEDRAKELNKLCLTIMKEWF
ncbi:MAG: phosphomannomutase, partial [Methylophagaceae bacterium]